MKTPLSPGTPSPTLKGPACSMSPPTCEHVGSDSFGNGPFPRRERTNSITWSAWYHLVSRVMRLSGDPPPADLTPSGRRGSRLRRCTLCPLTALQSWRLPDLLSRMGSWTTMTGSELAGHRLLGGARRGVLRTTLLTRRGGARPPLKRPPPPGLRPPPAPSGGGQCRDPLRLRRR